MDFFQFASYAEQFIYTTLDNNGMPINKYWICLLVGALCFLVVYIFQVFGLLTIAKREGYRKKWMIFVPILNTYYIGVCAQKNNVYGMKSTTFAIITAVLEGVLVVGYILYYISIFLCWDYAIWMPYADSSYVYLYDFSDSMPSSLNWLGWIFMYGSDYILYWVELVFIVARMLLLTAFFRTYAAQRYLLFSIVGALLPLSGILIYAVRNNTGMSYQEYIRRVRERNYRMYQQQNGNPYNQNPYNQNPYNNNPYNNPYNQPPGGQGGNAPDPFGEYGSSSSSGGKSSNSDESPFDDFN